MSATFDEPSRSDDVIPMMHDDITPSRHIQLFGEDSIGRGMVAFRGAGSIPPESCVLHVPPVGEMYARWNPLRAISAELRHLLLGDDSVSPPLLQLCDDLWRLWKLGAPSRYVIVFGKTDQEWKRAYERLLPGNVVAVFANNVRFRSARSVPYPMGRDWRLAEETYRSGPQPPSVRAIPKRTACYANFGTDTHAERSRTAALCRRNPTIDCGDLGGLHRDYRVSYQTFFERLASSWFCICPRGAGLDTYRFWDCLYLGVVPVIFDNALYRCMPARFPYVVVHPTELPTVDFNLLVERRLAEGVNTFAGIEPFLDAEYWRVMIFETLRLGRLPDVHEVLARIPPAPGPHSGGHVMRSTG